MAGTTTSTPTLRDGFVAVPGQRLGEYEIVRELGVGGFATVYEARRVSVGRRVALKLLHPSLRSHTEVYRRFVTEASTGGWMEHPHLVAILDAGEISGQPYLAMEYLPGLSLAEHLLQQERMPLVEAVDLSLAIGSALSALHSERIVHRDVKPSNILLAEVRPGKIVPKLLDLGIVKVVGGDDAFRTQDGSWVGTPRYMAPEQILGSADVDARADQFALAIVIVEAISGRKLFDGENVYAVVQDVVSPPAKDLTSHLPDAPRALRSALERALCKRPSGRYRDMATFMSELLPFASPVARHDFAPEFGKYEHRTLPPLAPSDPPTRDVPSLELTIASPPAEGCVDEPVPLADKGETALELEYDPRTRGEVARLARSSVARRSRRPQQILVAVSVTLVTLATVSLAFRLLRTDNDAQSPGAASSAPDPRLSYSLVVTPANAKVELDGVPVTGHVLKLLPDKKEHTLRVTAVGYKPYELRFDGAPPVSVKLEPNR